MLRIFKYFNIIAKRPGLIPLMTKHYIINVFFQRPSVRSLDIALTYRCQAHCKKCSAVAFIEKKRPLLSTQEICNIVDQAKGEGIVGINYTGGEPLLIENISEIVRYTSKKNMFVSVSTNGLLLHAPRINELKRNGLDVLQIGLFSPYEQEQDEESGIKGSFKKIIAAIEDSRKQGIITVINFVVTREMLFSDGLNDMYAIAKRHGGLLSLIPPAPIGRLQGKDNARLTIKEYNLLKTWFRKPGVTSHLEASFSKQCPAGREKLYISAYGDVYACPLVSQKLGNIREDDLRTIKQRVTPFLKEGCSSLNTGVV